VDEKKKREGENVSPARPLFTFKIFLSSLSSFNNDNTTHVTLFRSQFEEQKMICDESSSGTTIDKENNDPNSSHYIEIDKTTPSLGCYCDVIYCKARGMPLDHIGNNATLHFQEGYKGMHGAELQCSHLSCKNDGIKFRFCKHCEKAVAKRNFRKRHAHPELISLQEIEDTPLPPLQQHRTTNRFEKNMSSLPSLVTSIKSMPLTRNESSSIKDEVINHPGLCNPIVDHRDGCMDIELLKGSQNLQPMEMDLDIPTEDFAIAAVRDQAVIRSQCIETQIIPQVWNNLFLTRPRGGSLIEQQEWLQQVLNVADIGQQDAHPLDREEGDESISNPILSNSIKAVREEFRGSCPPLFIEYEETEDIEIKPKYRQCGKSMELKICTDLDLLGAHSFLLDSNGSVVISCTPRSYREYSPLA